VSSSMVVPRRNRGKIWLRRTHGLLGVVSAFNLFVLISTGFLLQHMALLRLDERVVSRRLLPGISLLRTSIREECLG
jgi:hypothetical protein